MRGLGDRSDRDTSAVRGLGVLGLNDSMLRTDLQRSTPAVRVLLLGADYPATERRAAETGEGYASYAAGIRLSIERLRKLGAQTGTAVVIFTRCCRRGGSSAWAPRIAAGDYTTEAYTDAVAAQHR